MPTICQRGQLSLQKRDWCLKSLPRGFRSRYLRGLRLVWEEGAGEEEGAHVRRAASIPQAEAGESLSVTEMLSSRALRASFPWRRGFAVSLGRGSPSRGALPGLHASFLLSGPEGTAESSLFSKTRKPDRKGAGPTRV